MKYAVVAWPVCAIAMAFGILATSKLSLAGSSISKSHARKTRWEWTFNPTTIETVQGKVTRITFRKGPHVKPSTEWLSLTTDRGQTSVLLGPAYWLSKEKVKVNKGDNISVTGSLVTRNNKTVLVATEVRIGEETVDLQESNGTPLWSAMALEGE
jgi:hypothetical protein